MFRCRPLLFAMCLLACLPLQAFDLQGHRGARGLAPENTLAGFRAAFALGVDTLELDLVLTRDGALLVGHDLRLNPDLVRQADGAWLPGPAPGPAVRHLNLADPRWTAGLKLEDFGASVLRLVQARAAGTWSPFHGDLTRAALAEAQALKLKVVPWTVNDPAEIDRLLDWGVDGLISDYPDRVRAALARRGRPLPAAAP